MRKTVLRPDLADILNRMNRRSLSTVGRPGASFTRQSGVPVEGESVIPSRSLLVDQQQFRDDMADASETLGEVVAEQESLRDGTHPVYDDMRAIEETLDGTVKVWRTPERPTDLNDTSDLADLWVNPTDPSDIWRWEGSASGWVKQDDIDLSEFYTRLDAAESELDTLRDTDLPALAGRLDSIDGEVAEAQEGIGGLLGRMSSAESDVAAAQGAASAAQSAADQAAADAASAASTASDANQAALDAAGIANGKGKVIHQATAPTGVNANVNNLWIRLSDSKPHAYDGSGWVPVTDKAATDAAAAASSAQSAARDADAKAVAAQGTADQAASDAAAAMSAAQAADGKAVLAQQSADGKSTVSYGAAKKSSGAAGKEGDTHYVFSGSNLIATQRRTATAWVDASLGHQIIGSVDLGKATVGELHGQYIEANTVTVDKLLVGSFDNLIVDVVNETSTTEPHVAGSFGTLIAQGDSADADGVSPGKHLLAGRTEGNDGSTRAVMYWGGSDGTDRFRVEPGGTYRFSVLTRLGGVYPNGVGYMRLAVREESAGGGYVSYVAHGGNHSPTWFWREHVAEFTVGPGTHFVTLEMQMTAVGANYRLALPQFRQMNAGELIVDGSILARHIDTNSVMAELVSANLLNALTANIQSAWIEQSWIKSLVVDVADVEGLTFTNASGRFLRTELFAAGSISAEKLMIGSSENLIPNGAGEAGAAAGWATSLTWDTTEKPAGETGSFKSGAGQTGGYQVTNDWWDVEPGKPYRFEVWLKADKPNSRMYIEIRADGGAHAGTSTAIPGEPFAGGGAYPVSNQLVPTAWTKYAGIWTPNAGVTRAKVGTVYLNYTHGTERGATQYIAGMRLKPMVGATVIENGAVTSPAMSTTDLFAINMLGSSFTLVNDEGSEMISLAPGTDNFAVFGSDAGQASIGSDGSFSSTYVHADGFAYQGEDFTDILDARPRGLVARASNDQFPNAISGISSERPLSELRFQTEPGSRRMYKISLGGLHASASSNSWRVFRIRATTSTSGEAPQPTTSSTELGTIRIGPEGQWTTGELTFPRNFEPDMDVRLLVTITPSTGSAVNWLATGTTTLTVEDIGPQMESTGAIRSPSGGQPTPTQTYTKTYGSSFSRTYTGGGSARPDNQHLIYQGYTGFWPAGGTQRSMVGFPFQLVNDIAGATIEWAEVFLHYDHWHNGSGGIAYLGYHGNNAAPASFANSGFLVQSAGWPRGAGRWVRLPTSAHARLQNQTMRGITLYAPNTGAQYYGYARGHGQPSNPKLRIRYRK